MSISVGSLPLWLSPQRRRRGTLARLGAGAKIKRGLLHQRLRRGWRFHAAHYVAVYPRDAERGHRVAAAVGSGVL